MPLITDLKNPAMRNRHWDKIQEMVYANILAANTFFTCFKVKKFEIKNKKHFFYLFFEIIIR